MSQCLENCKAVDQLYKAYEPYLIAKTYRVWLNRLSAYELMCQLKLARYTLDKLELTALGKVNHEQIHELYRYFNELRYGRSFLKVKDRWQNYNRKISDIFYTTELLTAIYREVVARRNRELWKAEYSKQYSKAKNSKEKFNIVLAFSEWVEVTKYTQKALSIFYSRSQDQDYALFLSIYGDLSLVNRIKGTPQNNN